MPETTTLKCPPFPVRCLANGAWSVYDPQGNHVATYKPKREAMARAERERHALLKAVYDGR